MKNLFSIMLIVFSLALMSNSGCNETEKSSADKELQNKTEMSMRQANKEVGMPSIVNFTEKKNLKMVYELCDQEDFICYAYLANEMTGSIGQYLGKCVGYGIPYSTQFSNPDRLVDVTDYGIGSYQANDAAVLSQPEPNGLFKPEGLSATWLMMVDPETNEIRPVYIEPAIIVSPFKLK